MMHPQPLVSLLIPIYGVEAYIEQCARALFRQTYDRIEYIFVDDCSPDGSVALLEKVMSEFPECASRVRIVRHEHNRGLAAARNTAMKYAVGEWVLMHDSDDWLEPDAVERLVGGIDDGVDMVTCDFYQGSGPCDEEGVVQRQHPADGVGWLKACLGKESDIVWAVWSKLLRRSLFDHPGIGWTEGANMGEDFKIMLCLSCHIRGVKHMNVPLVHYRIRPGSYCFGKISRSKERDFCTNIADSVAYIRKVGMFKEFRQEITSFVIARWYDMILRVGLERRECLEMLPALGCWLFRQDVGLSFRRRLIVYCGVHGWKLPMEALMNLSARHRRRRK